ncbi:LLM class flavin-dependent oxidoreductase [Derxia gummosa]|uniref:LLM class flavin-dependent oxidoreductase n=1 Tax=Derxia gummosa DSM 723 TaxID=1121388 RepID=A0A8B6XAU0_9BURK|nr:LLM class flavin-dependent oxidoreductase [Derxia gummosa]
MSRPDPAQAASAVSTGQPAAKPIRFNAFAMACAGHQSPGLWRHPADRSHEYVKLDYWLDLARLLERGLFDGLFLADVTGVYDVHNGSPAAALRGGVQVPLDDPMLLVPAMATVTKHLGFGVTASTSYEQPALFARRMTTLDHITEGRVGWNIVTSYLDSAARNVGQQKQTSHDERYDQADDFLAAVYKLWETSWDDDAVRHDRAAGVYADPDKVHAVAHDGRWFRVPGIHLSEPSVQRTPVLFQAGTSPRGLSFAGNHAECVFLIAPTQAALARQVADVRAAVARAGRRPDSVRIYALATVITGATDAEADAKHADYRGYADIDASLALLSGWTGVDFGRVPLDATIEYLDTDAGRTALASFSKADPSRVWTVREAAEFIAIGGRGPVIVGGPRKVADQLQDWVASTGIDGFNLAYAVAPGSWADVVEHVVPELQRRGAYATSYADGPLRQRLFGHARLAPDHAGGRLRDAVRAARRAAALHPESEPELESQ